MLFGGPLDSPRYLDRDLSGRTLQVPLLLAWFHRGVDGTAALVAVCDLVTPWRGATCAPSHQAIYPYGALQRSPGSTKYKHPRF